MNDGEWIIFSEFPLCFFLYSEYPRHRQTHQHIQPDQPDLFIHVANLLAVKAFLKRQSMNNVNDVNDSENVNNQRCLTITPILRLSAPTARIY